MGVTAVEPNLYCSLLLFIDSMIFYRLLFNSNVFSHFYASTLLRVVVFAQLVRSCSLRFSH